MKYLSKNEIKNGLDKALNNKLKHYTILNTLLGTGLRASECSKLTVREIDFEVKKIGIVGKGDKYRDIYVSQELLIILKFWVKSNKLKPNDRLWTNRRESLWQISRKYFGKGAHALRHTYAINTLKATGNIEFVRQQLGHANLSSTQVYLKHMSFDKEIAALGGMYDE